MWSIVLVESLIYFAALIAALFLILALQVIVRILGWSELVWNIFPHRLFLDRSGRPRFGFRKRLVLLLLGSYLFIFAGLTIIAMR